MKPVIPTKVFLLLSFLCINNILYGQSMADSWKPVETHIMTKWADEIDPRNVLPEYPRPQMVREEWLNLNGLWEYAIRPKGDEKPSAYDGKILVPFAVESALSGVKKAVGETNTLWYKRIFDLPSAWKGKKIILHFGAVDWETKVWVNGNYIDVHRGGYDRFSYDITQYLTGNEKQELIVSVWDPVDTGTQPHGKQVKEPGGIMYTSVTGIWQTVWLEPVPEHFIGELKIIPGVDKGTVEISSVNSGEIKDFIIEAAVYDGANKISEEAGAADKPLVLSVPGKKLWTPDNPFLYDLKVVLKDKSGKAADEVSSYFGMRKISLGKDEKGITRMMLNDKLVFQFGPLDQGWWPDGLYTAPADEALRYDIEVTKQMGFNMARKHVKVEPERWYYWCDKLGLLVWQDMPSGDRGIGPGDPDIERSKESAGQFILELKEMVRENFNHPSIVMWVPFNEGWGQWNTPYVVDLLKEIDPTRLVDNVSGWADRNVGDVHDVHIYPGPGMPEPEENRAVVLGEFGGLGLPLEGHTWAAKNNWGYVSYADQSALTVAYEELVKKLFDLKDKGLSAAVYTQTTDVEVEVNGLMTYDRKVIKIDPGVITRLHLGYTSPAIESAGNIFIDSVKVSIVNKSPEGEVRYTTDGSEPGKSSPVYKEPIVVTKECTVKAKTLWKDGYTSGTMERKLSKVIPVKAINPGNIGQGIKFSYYKDKSRGWGVIPDFDKIKADDSGILKFIDFDPWKTGEYFGLKYEGYIKVPETGVYTFLLASDDGSKLIINDSLLIDNDGLHGIQEKPGSAALAEGYHKIRVEFLQGGGECGLTLRLKTKDQNEQPLSPEMLFYPKKIN
jgi:hypothetical protein